MNGVLLKNHAGILGLAIIDEARKVRNVVYDSLAKNILVTFDDGETEHLGTQIDIGFNAGLLSGKEICIGHFPYGGFGTNPTLEYMVPLRH